MAMEKVTTLVESTPQIEHSADIVSDIVMTKSKSVMNQVTTSMTDIDSQEIGLVKMESVPERPVISRKPQEGIFARVQRRMAYSRSKSRSVSPKKG